MSRNIYKSNKGEKKYLTQSIFLDFPLSSIILTTVKSAGKHFLQISKYTINQLTPQQTPTWAKLLQAHRKQHI